MRLNFSTCADMIHSFTDPFIDHSLREQLGAQYIVQITGVTGVNNTEFQFSWHLGIKVHNWIANK